jgi:hypothetical protein
MAGIDEIIRRPAMFLSDSGLPWLSMGLSFSAMGYIGLMTEWHPAHQWILQWALLGFVALVAWATWEFKRRMVFPRGRYVEPYERPLRLWDWIWPLILPVGLVAVILLLKDVRTFDWVRLLGPGLAVCFAIMSAVAARAVNRPILIFFAIYLLGLSVALWFIRSSGPQWLRIGTGVPMAVYGAVQLWRFLKANPRPKDNSG